MIKIALVDDNSFLIKATAEKMSFFEDTVVKFTAINGHTKKRPPEGSLTLIRL